MDFGDLPWIVWPLMGFAIWMMMAPRGAWGCGGRTTRRSRSSAEKSAEIDRLKKELNAAQNQIGALRSRLEAVETIVTDEEAELRREFKKLQES